ncbi:hypothetical protein HDZ31DRAFT_29899 [Schizophyllum fasciatum]
MGFFSSRRDGVVDSERTSTVVQVIRSRFYGKGKGKERDTEHAHTVSESYIPQQTAAEVLSGPPRSARLHHARSAPTKAHFAGAQSVPSSPLAQRTDMPTPPPAPPSRSAPPPAGKENGGSSPRKQTDTATVTLAQRLDELRVANAEGLLNDDEYRLLRQNLFERFSSAATVPTEAPLVPESRRTVTGQPSSPRPKSNFVVERETASRTPSLRSNKRSSLSLSTNVSNMIKFRRTPSASRDYSETSSVRSFTSNASASVWPRLRKKTSNSSISTSASAQPDAASITSSRSPGAHRKGGSTHVPHHLSHFSRDATRSTGSIRRLANPPSSFSRARAAAADNKLPSASFEDVFDEADLRTAADIRDAIAAVEAEGRRLMDAFSGLELTALTRAQARGSAVTLTSAPPAPAAPVDLDSVSVRSGGSARTGASRSVRRVGRSGLSNSSHAVSLHRKPSVSSTGTGGTSGTGRLAPPPVPALPIGQLSSGSTSSVNLVRTPMRTVPEDGGLSGRPSLEWSATQDPGASAHTEMEDIRRRREEVSARYEARLEYLRAKLKGAVLHEKLLKK